MAREPAKNQGVVLLDDKIAEAQVQIDEAQREIDKFKQSASVVCLGWTPGMALYGNTGCGAVLPIKDLTYIQTHWYTEPYGCTGGDYWNVGEGQFKCPRCGSLNRLYERPQVEALKYHFGKVEDTYDRH